ncbi:hypothetical protein P7C73_g6424, partial [Tremellales sp. Uapishka_1]
MNSSWPSLLLYAGCTLIALVTATALYLFREAFSFLPASYRNLQGPEPDSLIWGNLQQILSSSPPAAVHTQWIKRFGPTYSYTSLFCKPEFFSADPTAIAFMLSHADIFPKPDEHRNNMKDTLGRGLIVAEGHDHKRQRRLLMPGMTNGAVQGMMAVFFDKSYEMRDVLARTVGSGREVDMLDCLGKATLDIIGLTGFDYSFNSLANERTELGEAYKGLFDVEGTSLAFLQSLLPILKLIPNERTRIIKNAKTSSRRIGQALIDEKRRQILAVHADGVEKSDVEGKDLLSIMMRANLASDLRPDQRMSDEEVLAQITSFFVAGNETSSTGLTWILYTLAQNIESQNRLRAELLAVPEDRPSMDDLTALPYLDLVVKEVLRLHAPVLNVSRMAGADVEIPLGTPVRGRNGKMMDSVKLRKGTNCYIPLYIPNTATEIWGADAMLYHPERFGRPESKNTNLPGVWGNMMTFWGGARGCIGFRFSIIEMKVILFMLIRNFYFEEAPGHPVIAKRNTATTRPIVVGEEDRGFQLPLLVSPVIS